MDAAPDDSGRDQAPAPLHRRSFVQSFRQFFATVSSRKRSTVVASGGDASDEVARLQHELHLAQANVSAYEAKVKSLEGELQQAATNNNRGATVAGGPPAFTLPGTPHKSVLLKGHTSSVRFVTQLSHGRVCSASEDKTIRIFNVQTGECESVLSGHTGPVSGVVQLVDGRICSGSYDKQLIIWNVNMGTIENTLLGHDGSVRCLVQLSDGRIVSGGGGDMKLRVWNASSGQCEKTLAGHTDWVNCVCVVSVPSGTSRPVQYVCSGSNDNTVRVWNMATCACEKVFEGHTHYVTCCLQLQQGGLLASLSFDGTIRLWDVSSGQGKSLQTSACRRVITGNPCSTFVGVRLHQLRENAGHLIAGSDDKTVRVWDPATGHLVAELQVPTGKCVIGLWQLADGRIVTSHDDGLVRVWGGDSKMGSRALAIVTPPA